MNVLVIGFRKKGNTERNLHVGDPYSLKKTKSMSSSSPGFRHKENNILPDYLGFGEERDWMWCEEVSGRWRPWG